MSADDFRGRFWAIRELMRAAQREIDCGERAGADRRYRTAVSGEPACREADGWDRAQPSSFVKRIFGRTQTRRRA